MHDFGDFAFGFWWLIFPVMGFAFGGFNMYLSHRRSQQAMEILRAYAQQGKDPPPEILAAVTGMQPGAVPPGAAPFNGPYGAGYGGQGYNGGPWGWGPPWGLGWGWRGAWRGPMWSWSRAITFGAIALGFAFAGRYSGLDASAVKAFTVVSIIMGVVAVAMGLQATLVTLFSRNAPRP